MPGAAVGGPVEQPAANTQPAVFEYAAAQQAYEPVELRHQIALLQDHNE